MFYTFFFSFDVTKHHGGCTIAAQFVPHFHHVQPIVGHDLTTRHSASNSVDEDLGASTWNGKPSPVIDGFTGEQRVFLGWAQAWRVKRREELARQILVTSPHSPAKYRVNGVLPNIPGFYQAFDVKEGDGMYLPPEQRVKIW